MSNAIAKKESITIRSAVPADYDAVIQVLRQAWEKYALAHPDSRAELDKALLTYLEPGHQERFVAESDGVIIGTAELYHIADDAYGKLDQTLETPVLRRLAVLPSWQGKGIATLLMQESVKRSLRAGASNLYLHTSTVTNAPAVRLYEHLGFVRATDQDISYGDYFMEGFRLDLKAGLREE